MSTIQISESKPALVSNLTLALQTQAAAEAHGQPAPGAQPTINSNDAPATIADYSYTAVLAHLRSTLSSNSTTLSDDEYRAINSVLYELSRKSAMMMEEGVAFNMCLKLARLCAIRKMMDQELNRLPEMPRSTLDHESSFDLKELVRSWACFYEFESDPPKFENEITYGEFSNSDTIPRCTSSGEADNTSFENYTSLSSLTGALSGHLSADIYHTCTDTLSDKRGGHHGATVVLFPSGKMSGIPECSCSADFDEQCNHAEPIDAAAAHAALKKNPATGSVFNYAYDSDEDEEHDRAEHHRNCTSCLMCPVSRVIGDIVTSLARGFGRLMGYPSHDGYCLLRLERPQDLDLDE
ncbi:uncharacterized protein V1518DRAFT_409271 [Limtongia smithiae]|uniref:uncharacterized protein n=1 Tax=Limtongia smithiae TaxID=1125753 RepID=UPI0034CFDE7A